MAPFPARLRHALICLPQTLLVIGLVVSGPAFALNMKGIVTVEIPPQGLASALVEFGSQTGVQVMTAASVVAHLRTRGVKGRMSFRRALTRLLRGTSLGFVDAGIHSVAVGKFGSKGAVAPASQSIAQSPQEVAGDSPSSPADPEDSTARESARKRAESRNAELLNTVTVTGTHIAGVKSVSPLIVIGRRQIDESGYTTVGAVLRALPENFSGGQNPGVIGAAGNNQFSISGASSANLMGLGADSTLTLVDGHRLAYDGYQNGVDLSIIPLAAVKLIEVMTGGGSAIYGSSAVAGVVNVILRHHFQGITADALYGDVTRGQSPRTQFSLLAGHDWHGGNVTIAYEYSHDSQLPASERVVSRTAVPPTWLLPDLNRDSAFLLAHQRIGSVVTASLEALYTERSDSYVVGTSYAGRTDANYAFVKVREYGVSPRITVALPADWRLKLSGTVSGDTDNELGTTFLEGSGLLLNQFVVSYRNQLRVGELEATGTVWNLPSGPMRLAVGAGYRSEGFQNPQQGAQTTTGNRNVDYVYAETNLPLVAPSASRVMLERLDLDAAVRYEHYSDFGPQADPRIGLVYRPLAPVDLRATWSKSFMAPWLNEVYGPQQLYLEPSSLLGGTPGTTTIMSFGSNRHLGPETATSDTISLDITPAALPGLKITPTYFQIHYDNRVVQPVTDFTASLTNPNYAPFVITNPSAAQQATLIAAASFFANYSGMPYDSANVAYFLNDADQNASVQQIHGVNLVVQDQWPLFGGNLAVNVNGAWLSLKQQDTSSAPLARLSGTIFNPPDFKGLATATWRGNGWSITGTFNYVSPEWDNSAVPRVRVASWSTVDTRVSYDFDASSVWWLHGVKAGLAVQNLFDRNPPRVAASSTEYPGIGYDSTNASALGRFVSVDLSKHW